MFTFIALPMMSLPFVPHALGMVIHTPAPEQVGIEPAVSLLFVMQALQHNIQVRFWQGHRLFFRGAFWFAPELNDLPFALWAIHISTVGKSKPDGALPVQFPAPRWLIPFLPAIERGTPKQMVYPGGIFARP